jgi:diphosphomevalonate decarboxylase
MLTSVPALIYWQPATLAVMREVRQMRSTGTPVFFSIDAGPQVKVFCPPEFESTVAQLIGAIPGVLRTISTPIGGAPELLTQ